MNLAEYVKGLKRRTKNDYMPGQGVMSDKPCPLCGLLMFRLHPCCGQPNPILNCNKCSYKQIIEKET